MKKLEKYLQVADYDVLNINYRSTSANIKTLALQIVQEIKETVDLSIASKVHFVTHSMGGIILRYIVQESLLPVTGNVVMLAPPNQGAVVIDKVASWRWLKHIVGPACLELGTHNQSTPNQLKNFNAPLGVIAGTNSLNPIWSLITPKPSDSTVMVESTKLLEMLDHLEVPFIHSFIMKKKTVLKQIEYFLRTKAFER